MQQNLRINLDTQSVCINNFHSLQIIQTTHTNHHGHLTRFSSSLAFLVFFQLPDLLNTYFITTAILYYRKAIHIQL